MKLYTYFRSSAAYRVRIALNLKGLAYEAVPVHLLRSGGEQLQPAYRAVNPAAMIPSLEIDDGATLTQSMAIIEYLDETHPAVPLMPADPLGRARVRALALTVACDIHPLGNLRVLKYLVHELTVDDEAKAAWSRHWISEGFTALEAMLAGSPATGRFCHGDTPTLADCCLVPQVFNALRFEVDMTRFPTIARIHAACGERAGFAAAHPSKQPDAE
ncbi:maleylacetoacetate isomerase [Massilia sp. RP-1-19]|uniref:Maleylacetoacetate isomerase n=1 Tax=Massilia polaris TaxID=2728846 RepID=A0A848HEP9_9BURK|nr:maleylacetoacetate isomerase [Massilia polaris]NML59577.1 maleylacetoacetate isomerase [Massilia polaris]